MSKYFSHPESANNHAKSKSQYNHDLNIWNRYANNPYLYKEG